MPDAPQGSPGGPDHDHLAYLGLLSRAAALCDEESPLSDAAAAVLEDVCTVTGWAVGRLCQVDDSRPGPVIATAGGRLGDPAVEGLSDRVVVSGRPEWSTQLPSPRGPSSAVAVPVVVVGLGLSLTVAPLTAAVMAAVEERHVGVASGVNNAVARIGTLLSVALLPLVAGLGEVAPGDPRYTDGVSRALLVAAGLCVVGGVVAFATVRRGANVAPVVQPDVSHACADPSVREPLPS